MQQQHQQQQQPQEIHPKHQQQQNQQLRQRHQQQHQQQEEEREQSFETAVFGVYGEFFYFSNNFSNHRIIYLALRLRYYFIKCLRGSKIEHEVLLDKKSVRFG